MLKFLVDEHRFHDKAKANGRFFLTGSTNIMTLHTLSDALVGRMSILSLYPLSACEVLGNGEPVLNTWFDNSLPFRTLDERFPLDTIIHAATFPEISGKKDSGAMAWFDDYLTAILQRDIRQLAEIEKVTALPLILQTLATRTGSLLNDTDCARAVEMNLATYRRYRILLESIFLITLVRPWHRHIGKRLVKSPKLFFTDTALPYHQLGVNVTTLRQDKPTLYGHILENFVASELMKQLSTIQDATLYHFRTQDGQEVDFVIERRGGKLIGIEVKASSTLTEKDFKGLEALKVAVGENFVRGIVLYAGNQVLSFGNDMVAMPLECLWQ